MDLKDLLARTGGVGALSRELGVNESQAASGAAALLPAILAGLGKQARAQPGGGAGLDGVLGQLGGGGLLDDVVSPLPTDVNKGNAVLGQIFGSKEVSRSVAQDAASRSGLDPALLKKMLPIVAMVATGMLAKQRNSQPSAGDGVGALLGGLRGGLGAAPAAGGLGGLLSMLDADGDGNPLDDILARGNR